MVRKKDFAAVIRAKLRANPALAEAVEAEDFSADIATQVYELRREAKLTQQQLAEKIGTTQSVISRIEDADYGGHSLDLLKRIAKALNRKMRVEFHASVATPDVEITETFAANWPPQADWRPVICDTSLAESSTPQVIP